MTFASILLAISGVFGIVSLSCERRRKEIAIRKVNGAKLPDIMRLFLSEYMYMLLAAAVIVFPIGYYLAQKWSANYLTPAPIHWWVYPLLFLTLALVIIASVFWQIYKAGTENPSEVMKSEKTHYNWKKSRKKRFSKNGKAFRTCKIFPRLSLYLKKNKKRPYFSTERYGRFGLHVLTCRAKGSNLVN